MPKYIPKFKISLNLLYSQGTPLKWPAKILTWALSAGRYIGIAVEILVLATFAARFKFDADLADLKEKINQQIPYIESLQKEESLIKQTQFRYPKHEGYKLVFKVKLTIEDNYSRLMYAVFMPDAQHITILCVFNRKADYNEFYLATLHCLF